MSVTGLHRPLFISCQQFGGKFDFTQINLLCEAAVLHKGLSGGTRVQYFLKVYFQFVIFYSN